MEVITWEDVQEALEEHLKIMRDMDPDLNGSNRERSDYDWLKTTVVGQRMANRTLESLLRKRVRNATPT